ncbi:6-phosphogluconolactonase [Candidatus Vallotia cooleyia]|uniref:6-phosphogluconolactonase n=1 Tax=Candidatus Vallotiella adelgis TaxID=1177211 RepID=UPI001D006C6F|nr:6-phosphogluconolactonase [Candidatus Vallotia cooleyia]UDG82420.1 6-phosphogluconolactonase [Candidatus Vallotia cooleyia]
MIRLHVFDDAHAQKDALSEVVVDSLQSTLAARIGGTRSTLAVSGGTSPQLFLRDLSSRTLDWSRIDVTLVDDRWVPPTHADSNARLICDTLMQNAARDAVFRPLVDIDQAPEAYVMELNADSSRMLPDVAVLGMGEDGHTASIFADAPQWDLATRAVCKRYMLFQPQQAPHLRVSLSLAALREVGQLFLLFSGRRKLDVLRTAIKHPQNNAISHLANDTGVNVDAYWCA